MDTLGNDGEVIHPFIRLANLIPERWLQVAWKWENKAEPVVEDTLAVNINIWEKYWNVGRVGLKFSWSSL